MGGPKRAEKEYKEDKHDRRRRGNSKSKTHKHEDRSRSRDRRQQKDPEAREHRNEKKEHPMWEKSDEDTKGRTPKYHLKKELPDSCRTSRNKKPTESVHYGQSRDPRSSTLTSSRSHSQRPPT